MGWDGLGAGTVRAQSDCRSTPDLKGPRHSGGFGALSDELDSVGHAIRVVGANMALVYAVTQ